ncbi:MAG TPA: hypothetical protein VGG64_04530 [Pirellulales bacterium]|jgi:hypothetical protein
MNEQLLFAAIELLESVRKEGCDGLVVASADYYATLQKVVHAMTGLEYGRFIEE